MSWQFNGSNSVAYIPSGSWTYFNQQGWTISFWFKILGTGTNAHQHWFYHRSGVSSSASNTVYAFIAETNNQFSTFVRSDSAQFLGQIYSPGSTNEWTSSGWVHVAVTRSKPVPNTTNGDTTDDLSYGSMYLNGGLAVADSDTNVTDANAGRIVFGKIGNASTDRTLSGCLAEWAKFDRVLTSEEIGRLYSGNSPLNMNPTIYYPMRNDYTDKVMGLSAVGISNVALLNDHPISGYKSYYPTREIKTDTVSINNRVGKLEEKGYIDTVSWSPGQVLYPTTADPSFGYKSTGLMFSQARVGEAYIAAPNAPLSGCVSFCHVDTSGILTITLRNTNGFPVTPAATEWKIYRL